MIIRKGGGFSSLFLEFSFVVLGLSLNYFLLRFKKVQCILCTSSYWFNSSEMWNSFGSATFLVRFPVRISVSSPETIVEWEELSLWNCC